LSYLHFASASVGGRASNIERDVVLQMETSTGEASGDFADACRLQLGRILSSSDFEATEREHRFLKYVVDESLAGRGERIKAYSIATEVFGRDEFFNPQSDPIVRIEAGHLRRALERYYLTSGQGDPVLIQIPKGGYVRNSISGQRQRSARCRRRRIRRSRWMRLEQTAGCHG